MNENGDYEEYLKQQKDDENRTYRIRTQVTSLGRNAEQKFSAWHLYLKNKLKFPFDGLWKHTFYSDPEKVIVIELLDLETCQDAYDILVKVQNQGIVSEKPLFSIIEVLTADDNTKEAVEDWHFWIKSMDGAEDDEDSFF